MFGLPRWLLFETGNKSLVYTELFNDPTGRNYYGKTKLFLFEVIPRISMKMKVIEPINEQNLSPKLVEVETPEGQLHDFSWAPNGESFVVVAGSMPSKAIIYDASGAPLGVICNEYRNRIQFSPKGRFVLVYGIGNLPGNFDVYSLDDLSLVGRFKSPSSSLVQWSEDEELILTQIVFSKIKEKNLFRVNH